MDENARVFVISVAAELAGMHPQTLRQYDRLGLVTPSRTRGGGRRYSARDIDRLRDTAETEADDDAEARAAEAALAADEARVAIPYDSPAEKAEAAR